MKPFINLTEKKLKTILKKYKKIFLIRGKKSYEICGAKKLFQSVFDSLICDVYEYFDFTDNPKWEEISKGIKACSDFNPDLILAVGGGSVIDTAKCIKLFQNAIGNPADFSIIKNKAVPFFAFPTTSGTGSESTHFAVCYYNEKKYSIADKTLIPDKAFIDYRFTLNNTSYLTACTGADALCQAIESFWAVKSTLQSRVYAYKAIKYLYLALTDLYNSKGDNIKCRRNISIGSYYAGKAINISTTTAAHAYSYEITKLYNIPHGHAVAITFPYFFDYNSRVNVNNCNDKRGVKFVKSRITIIKKILDIENPIVFFQSFFNVIFSGTYKIKLTSESINLIINRVNVQRLNNNPVKVDSEELRKYLELL